MGTASDNYMTFVGSATFQGNALNVVGESTDPSYPNGFELKTFEFGIENANTVGSGTGGAGAGKAKFNAFKITRNVDYGSANLFKGCAAGCHFPEVHLNIRKAGGGNLGTKASSSQDYLVFKFYMVFVTNISWSGGEGEDAPTENIEFAYGAMALQYKRQKMDGSLDQSTTGKTLGSWNQLKNRLLQKGDFADISVASAGF